MVSFCKLMENMERNSREEEDKAALTIEKGLEADGDFWEKFKGMLHNTSGLSSLLGVSEDKIATWHKKIQEAEDRNNAKKNKIEVCKNKKII